MSQTTTISVPGIHCGHCKSSIEGALGQVAGVEAATVSVEAKTVDVTYDEASVDLASIRTAIEDQGYDVPE
jgi:copper chaperone